MDRDLIICRCLNVTVEQVENVVALGMREMGDVRRLSRAGMGICQGAYCEELVRQVVARAAATDQAGLSPARVRAPIVPLPLAFLADD